MTMKLKGAFAGALFALTVLPTSAWAGQTGEASWYALTSLTASGERCDPNAMTAAHRTLPFGTRIKVTNLRNGKAVVVRINDRGPFAKNRVLDVTRAAARKLGFISRGHTRVRIEKVSRTTALGPAPRYPDLNQLVRLAIPNKKPTS